MGCTSLSDPSGFCVNQFYTHRTLLLETMWATAEADGTIRDEESAALKQAYKVWVTQETSERAVPPVKDGVR